MIDTFKARYAAYLGHLKHFKKELAQPGLTQTRLYYLKETILIVEDTLASMDRTMLERDMVDTFNGSSEDTNTKV